MPPVPIADLHEGMILQANLYDRRGRLLIPAKTALSERHLTGLKVWGVEAVEVHDPSAGPLASDELDPATIEAARAELAPLFQNTPPHPVTQKIFERCVLRRARMKPAADRAKDPPAPTTEAPAGGARPMIRPATLAGTADPLEWVRTLSTLPSLPASYLRLTEVMDHPRSSARDIARVIEEDAALTARLLKLVNSALFGFPGKIEVVSKALALVGTQQVKELALATSVFTMFRNVPPGALTMKGFWSHSLACGITARLLGQRRGEANPEAHFVGGLLHDIGTLTIAVNRPAMLADALAGAAARRVPIDNVERAWFGHDHAGVGAVLLEAWNLPPRHRAAVNCHHAPQKAGVFATEAAVVHVADIIATAMQFGSAGDPFVPGVVPTAWEALRLNPNDIGAIMDETDRLFSSVASTFLSEDGP